MGIGRGNSQFIRENRKQSRAGARARRNGLVDLAAASLATVLATKARASTNTADNVTGTAANIPLGSGSS